jgi:membrane protease YdiL (CAAX protease family)
VTEPGLSEEAGWHWLPAPLTALATALLSMLALVSWLRTGPFYDGNVVLLASYLVVWLPFIAAVVYVSMVRGSRSLVRDMGLRLTVLDVFIGVGAALLARAAVGIVEIALTGRMIGLGVTFGETAYDGWWLFGTILAPVCIAPFVEELFFRGVLQRAVFRTGSARLSPRTAFIVSIIISATLFALLHLTQAANLTGALVLGLSSLIFGMTAALIAGLTGRIGGAIVAHVVFNGSLVLASLM